MTTKQVVELLLNADANVKAQSVSHRTEPSSDAGTNDKDVSSTLQRCDGDKQEESTNPLNHSGSGLRKKKKGKSNEEKWGRIAARSRRLREENEKRLKACEDKGQAMHYDICEPQDLTYTVLARMPARYYR